MRIWQRRRKVNGIVQEQLKETAFALLDDASKLSITTMIDRCLTDDM